MTYLQIMCAALLTLATSVVAEELPDVSDDHYHLRSLKIENGPQYLPARVPLGPNFVSLCPPALGNRYFFH